MKVNFQVHGVNRTQISMPVKVGEETIQAAVPCLEVELVTKAAASGSLTLRFYGDEVKAAEALYEPDADIVADMSVAD